MKNKNKTSLNQWLTYIFVGLLVVCGIGIVVSTAVSQETKPIFTIIWAGIAVTWALMYLAEYTLRNNWEEWYWQLDEAYNKLSQQFDDLCQTAKEVNDNNTKQNKLCDEVNKQNKELVESQQQILARCRELVDSLYDTRMELYKVDPTNPLLMELLEKYEELKEKEKENKEQEKIDL